MQIVSYKDTNISEFESFAANLPEAGIWQSYLWGQFQAKVPYRGKFLAIGVKDGEKLVMTAIIIKNKTRFGFSWLEIGRGPVFDPKGNFKKTLEAWELLLEFIKKIVKEERALFLRVAPNIKHDQTSISSKLFKGFEEAKHSAFPEWTLRLSLRLSLEDLLAQMKPKGRYNIKVAEKHNVKISAWRKGDQEKLDQFYKLLKNTGDRDGFSIHPKGYYENMLAVLGDYDAAKLYLAEHEEKVIAGIIVTFFGDTATYYYGASSYEHRQIMAPYLLQWHAICEAKKSGCLIYDFLGISGGGKSSWDARLKGVTEFKQKFGGEAVHYAKTAELVFRPFWKFLFRA